MIGTFVRRPPDSAYRHATQWGLSSSSLGVSSRFGRTIPGETCRPSAPSNSGETVCSYNASSHRTARPTCRRGCLPNAAMTLQDQPYDLEPRSWRTAHGDQPSLPNPPHVALPHTSGTAPVEHLALGRSRDTATATHTKALAMLSAVQRHGLVIRSAREPTITGMACAIAWLLKFAVVRSYVLILPHS